MGLDRAAEKRRRILDAARLLFVREGLRGTTMEAIARAAGIAKPTLYGYFSDKDAVFTALLDELTDTLTAAFEAGMAGSGTPAQRIGAALAGKYGAIAAVIEASPFAEELYSTHSRVSLRFRALDMQMNETILAVLREAGVREPAELNRLLQAAAYGVARKLVDEASVRAALPVLAERLITPRFPWELMQIGNCGAPIETPHGWILLTHGVGPMRTYAIGAMLLDLENPLKIIGHLREPLIVPGEKDREGYVPNVVYTCGAMTHDDQLFIPFAVADKSTSFVVVETEALTKMLLESR